MFYGCSSLSSLPDLSKWNMDKINNKENKFYYCISLSYVSHTYYHFNLSDSEDCLNTINYPILFIFEWRGPGNEVLITGDFVNWKQHLVMKKNSKTGIFESHLYLGPKKYHFKFIVDNNWSCSNKYPTEYDQVGNLINYIDLELACCKRKRFNK